MRRAYLDYNATAPMRPAVQEAVAAALGITGNASSIHGEGRAALAKVEEGREALRRFINAPIDGIIFTSGGTEAIHHGIRGLVEPYGLRRVLISAVEHAASMQAAAQTGLPVEVIPVQQDGVVDLEVLKEQLAAIKDDEPFLAIVMAANNETGVIQPIADLAALVHEKNGLLMVDACQAIGRVPINFVMSGADLMVVTAHKMGGPVGVGALIVNPNLRLAPLLTGGGQELGRRAGTVNVAGIVGFGVACDSAREDSGMADRVIGLRDQLETELAQNGVVIFGEPADRLPGVCALGAPGFDAQTQLMTLDLAGVAVSSGAACSSGKAASSHVLKAMGVEDHLAQCAIRVSFGWQSCEQDVQQFIEAWRPAYDRIKKRVA